MKDEVILVNEKDEQVGTCEKIEAHMSGKLHRAFSIFIFSSREELLLQKRAKNKYHSGGLWTNTCCSHPRPGEDVEAAAHRRLLEEMDFDAPLKKAFSFQYRAVLDRGLTENEYDHVLVGLHDEDPRPNPEEAESWKWADIKELKKEMAARPEEYTHWFKVAAERLDELRDIAKKE